MPNSERRPEDNNEGALNERSRSIQITAENVSDAVWARGAEAYFRKANSGEPSEELEDAELSRRERQQAIERERARREGLI
jgi:hypothetical protein